MVAERILVVDADSDTAHLIAQTLEHDGLSVRTVPDRAAATVAMREFRPALVISNATSCGADGIDLRHTLEAYAAPTLVLTMRDVLYNRSAMLARARVLVSVPRPAHVACPIVERLEPPIGGAGMSSTERAPLPTFQRARGVDSALSGSTAQPTLVLDAALSDIYVNGHAANLTPTEFGIISRLVAAGGATVTYDAMLEHIWGDAYRGDRHLLQVHMQRLRQKLESAGAPRHVIRNRWRVGYAVEADVADGSAVWSTSLPRQLAG